MIRRLACLLLALAAPTFAVAEPTIGLPNGQPAAFAIPAGSFSTSYYFDVTDSGQQLVVDLTNGGAGDTDLMLRYGSPFPDRSEGGAVADFDLLLRYAHYRGISANGGESIAVQRSNTIPLRNGRWYIVVYNNAGTAQNVQLSARVNDAAAKRGITFVFNRPGPDCDVAPWTDTTPATPIDGNNGTTLGEQRRNALTYAGTQLSNAIESPVAVTVRACWKAQGGNTTDGATIAYAGPDTFVLDGNDFPQPYLPEKYSWYAIGEAVRQAGTTRCGAVGGSCDAPDIEATFNTDIDPPANVINRPFYYGYTAASKPVRTIDFVTTSMHELTHGLGFVGLVNVDAEQGPVGARATSNIGVPYDDAFGKQLVTVNTIDRTYRPFLGPATTDADRAAALVSNNGLRWAGIEAVNSPENVNRNQVAPDNFPLMFAPCERDDGSQACATRPGSTLSHTVQPGDLMNAFDNGESIRDLGLALPMLKALGWSNAASVPPTYGAPIPSNWFDRAHNGHGIDFQLFDRDPVNGDRYFVIFYTYDANGVPEWYQGFGRIVDGIFVGGKESRGISLQRVIYNAALRRSELDPSVAGTIEIDFNQAANSPACRSGNRDGASQLAIMSWTLRNETGRWCMEPAIAAAARSTPDFGGHWWAGNGDSGWGMELFTLKGGAQPLLVGYLYYPDGLGNSRWAVIPVTPVDLANTATINLQEITSGFCRLCTPPAQAQTRNIGTIQFKLTQPQRNDPPGTANSVTINLAVPGTNIRFSRTNTPITLLSQLNQ
ncbi:MAG TPA: hypothetical protein VM555_02500 [Tahibacter sp.]|nr:hypothetical protein [Tahibacter sp.]